MTPKIYVDNAIAETSLVRNNKDNDFGNYNLTNMNCITLNKQAENDNEVITKAYVDQFHQENEPSRRDVGLHFYDESSDLVKNNITNDFNNNIILNVRSKQVNNDPSDDDHVVNKKYVDAQFLTKSDSSIVKNNQDNDFNNNIITNVRSIQINDSPTNDNHVSNKKYIDDQLDTTTIVRLNDNSNDRYLQVHVHITSYNLQIYNKTQIIDTTEMIFLNTGNDLLQNWKIIYNNRNGEGKPSDFIKSTKSNSPTGNSGATSLPPIGNCFMYIETSGVNHDTSGHNVFVSFERTDIIHISNITFYHNRFSTSDPTKRSMGKLDIQLLRNGVWEPEFTIQRDTNFSVLSTDWTLLNMNIVSQPTYGIKIVYSGINNAHADMCFSDIFINHTIF